MALRGSIATHDEIAERERVCIPNRRKWCATATGKRPGKWAMEAKTRCGVTVFGGTLDRDARVMTPTCKDCKNP